LRLAKTMISRHVVQGFGSHQLLQRVHDLKCYLKLI
jgi:hypothetical protein